MLDRNNTVSITMLKTAKGASDQVTIGTYEEGKEYEVSGVLAQSFIENGDAEFTNSDDEKKYGKSLKKPANKALTNEDYANKSDTSKNVNNKSVNKGETK